MEDSVQNDPQPDQWLPMFEKGEKRANSLGSGALRFIRTRSSIRRDIKRQSTRSKNGDTSVGHETSGSGGGFGKWLREHLGGGSKNQDAISSTKSSASVVDGSENEKPFNRIVYSSQNLYCSLPREHSRHAYNVAGKTGHGSSIRAQGHDRQRSSSVNHHEKTTFGDLGTLTRGGPIYGSEGKTVKKRNRDRRRHSLNETHEQGRQRRRRFGMTTRHRKSRNPSFKIADADRKEQPVNVFEVLPIKEEDKKLAKHEKSKKDKREGDEAKKEEEIHEKAEEEKVEQERADSVWNVVSDQSDVLGTYDEFYGEGDEGETQTETPLSPSISTAEKSEEEVARVEEPDFAELPAEDAAEREAIIKKLKEVLVELRELRRKNRLLELWIHRHMKKTQQKMTPSDRSKDPEIVEHSYKITLRDYKMTVDDILTQLADLTYEMDTYTSKVTLMREEDEVLFNGLLERQQEIGVGLVCTKTGKKITDKLMTALTRRQKGRRKILAQGRLKYIRLQHRLEDIHARLKSVETLGEGMTTMDYETLYVANIAFKDKLDERNHELEDLRLKIAKTVNGVAHYKEKEVCVVEDIVHQEQCLKDYCLENNRARGRVNKVHSDLNAIRDTLTEKKQEAGLLLAPDKLIEMERLMKRRDFLQEEIERLQQEIQDFQPARQSRQKSV